MIATFSQRCALLSNLSSPEGTYNTSTSRFRSISMERAGLPSGCSSRKIGSRHWLLGRHANPPRWIAQRNSMDCHLWQWMCTRTRPRLRRSCCSTVSFSIFRLTQRIQNKNFQRALTLYSINDGLRKCIVGLTPHIATLLSCFEPLGGSCGSCQP